MHKLLIALFGLTLFAAAPDEIQPVSIDQSSAPALTIYNQNFFVAREHLPLDLNAGVNHVNFAGISAHLEPDSVILRDLTGRPLQILEQSYRNDPVSEPMLLSFFENKTLDFIRLADDAPPVANRVGDDGDEARGHLGKIDIGVADR